MMNILVCGDIVGKMGRKAIATFLPTLKKQLALDLVIANAENAAHGFGLTPKIYDELLSYGVDAFTLGNHFLDQPIISEYLKNKNNIVRPLNLVEHFPGTGLTIVKANHFNVAIINLMGSLFIKQPVNNPFLAIDEVLSEYKLKQNVDTLIVDFHAEATSEKNAMFLYLNGRVSAVIGTHTHIPTNDARILSKGTAVQTDIGMCGDYTGVVGMKYQSSIARFINGNPTPIVRLEPENQSATLCAVLIQIDCTTGLASVIKPIIVGEVLANTIDLRVSTV